MEVIYFVAYVLWYFMLLKWTTLFAQGFCYGCQFSELTNPEQVANVVFGHCTKLIALIVFLKRERKANCQT